MDITDGAAEAYAEGFSAQLDTNKVSKYVFQLERGGERKRAHLQGWIYMANACTYKAVHKLFPAEAKAWIKKARGTPEQCWDYCTKPSTRVAGPWQKGDKPDGQGKRNDIKEFAEAAKGLRDRSVTLKQLQEDHKSVEARYMKYFDRVVMREQQPRDFQTKCTLAWGPSATGKTHKIRSLPEQLGFAKDEVYYVSVKEHPTSQQWWDNYDGQACVVIEDAEPGFMTRGYFLRMIDKVPLLVQTKGGFRHFLAQHVFISSNYGTEVLFPFHDDAVKRRFHTVWKTEYGAGYRLFVDTDDIDLSSIHAVWTREK